MLPEPFGDPHAGRVDIRRLPTLDQSILNYIPDLIVGSDDADVPAFP